MESSIKSSFIPETPLAAFAPRHKAGKGGMDLLFLVTLVIFVASATLAVGVFLYGQFLTRSSQSKIDQLERAKAAFEPSLINELTRLDDRMRAADDVLHKHTAPSALFHLLEQLTLQTVSFSSLDFAAVDDSTATMKMNGIAQSVNSIALEADLLSKSGVITSPIFTNINRLQGGVRFDFSASVNTDAIRYRSLVQTSVLQQQGTPSMREAPLSPFGTPDEGGQNSAAPSAGQGAGAASSATTQ